MDVSSELEALAVEAIKHDEKPMAGEVKRWQSLFNCNHSKALQCMRFQKLNFSRRRLSDGHWRLIQAERKAEGYDKEAYDRQLDLRAKAHPQNIDSDNEGTHILRLDGPFVGVKLLRAVIGCNVEITRDFHSEGNTLFARIKEATRGVILGWLSTQKCSGYQPTFIRLSLAEKYLSGTSLYPTLGLD
ncbi:MAG: hypothetical protein Q9225_003973 [Loekoesia sp. 1 TL-2023]